MCSASDSPGEGSPVSIYAIVLSSGPAIFPRASLWEPEAQWALQWALRGGQCWALYICHTLLARIFPPLLLAPWSIKGLPRDVLRSTKTLPFPRGGLALRSPGQFGGCTPLPHGIGSCRLHGQGPRSSPRSDRSHRPHSPAPGGSRSC